MNRLSPFKWFVLQNFPFIEADFDALTNYELMCKVVEYLNETIAKTNELGNQVEVLTNWFNNLDVQEEINNKLDEMADSGELQEIMADYLNTKAIFGFDTKQDMKSATNLVAGSYAKTYGNTNYKTGDGYFYKVREITNQDVVDDDNIIALADEDLVAEKIPDARIDEINAELSEKARIKALKKTKAVKFTALEDGISKNGVNYYYDRNLKSKSNALPMVSFTNQSGTFPVVQGVAVWNRTGQVLYVNSEEIYTISYTNTPTKTTIYSDDFGHGGDACIYEDDMYITDSDNSNIYKVNLQTGTKTTYSVNDSDITNSEHEYTPKLAGICMNDKNFAYILVCDDESYSAETGHKIQDGSTIRVYKYKFSDASVEKLFELEQDIVYGQGMTKDNEYFYIVGNKEFTSNYEGSKLHIISLEDFTIYDTLENSSNEEFEGIDYGCTRGYEGLFTACGRAGISIQYGVLSFYGNYLISYENTSDSSKKILYTKRNGLCIVNMYLTGSFNAGTTVTISNVFNNLPKIFTGPVIANSIPIVASSYTGTSRNYEAQIKYDIVNNSIDVLTQTNSPNSTYVTLTFIYPCM